MDHDQWVSQFDSEDCTMDDSNVDEDITADNAATTLVPVVSVGLISVGAITMLIFCELQRFMIIVGP